MTTTMTDPAKAGRYNDASEESCQWDAVSAAAYASGYQRAARRCGFCGAADVPLETVATSWRSVLICGRCVEAQDWSGWDFDPLLNEYTLTAARAIAR